MQILKLSTAAAAVSSGVIMTACSSAGPTGAGPAVPTAARLFAPRYAAERVRPDTISPKQLFVGESGYSPYVNEVAIYQNGTFKKLGQITKGIKEPLGMWVDSHGLYVANTLAENVTQYSSTKAKPFTYNVGMYMPDAVATDHGGDVFEADYAGYVSEYHQKQNVLVAACTVSGGASGVAIDASGNVFVAYTTSPYSGYVQEFTNFSSCRSQTLGVGLGNTAGMAIDKKSNLIVCEYGSGQVDIIKPPYKSVSSILYYASHAGDVKINSAQNRAWITANGQVIDVYYPSGKVLKNLGHIDAKSAVDGSNYVP